MADNRLPKYFEEDFFQFVSERIMAAGRVMPGCGAVRYESYTADHSRLYGNDGAWHLTY